MPDTQKKCPLCGENAQWKSGGHGFIYFYKECACGAYCVDEREYPMVPSDIKDPKYKHLPALLNERTLRGDLVPLLVFIHSRLPEAKDNITFADPISVDDLLAQWPETVPERIERCLCNLANKKKEAGEAIELSEGKDKRRDALLFAANRAEAEYYINALVKYGWVSDDMSHQQAWELVITPKGWARVSELTGGAERHRNPAFVAMWFGGDEQRDDMRNLFNDALLPAIKDAGYHAKRADTDEHNEPIMDRVIDDIRKAPFVVAELTNNNPGVYYEAGFAKGQNIEVIYCRKDGHRTHFDVTGINQVVYQDLPDLQRRLASRILGTKGRGPHKFDVEGE